MGNTLHVDQHELAGSQVFDPGRNATPGLGIAANPGFQIESASPVFVMGSCFAMEILRSMRDGGYDVTDGGLNNQYNPAAMHQQLRWAGGEPFDSRVLITHEGGVFDPCRHRKEPFATSAEAIQDRQAIHDRIREGVARASVLVFTLGLIEVWADAMTGVSLNVTPPVAARADEGRYSVRRLTHAECVRETRGFIAAARSINPGLRFIASVSPVPLKATFIDDDVLIANCRSKSTLRSALGEVVEAERDAGVEIDYFPSYEIVTLSDRKDVWREALADGRPDGRHVRREFISGVILRRFAEAYLPGA